jgi:glycosyltransferase involved in cell wall biosynthesis
MRILRVADVPDDRRGGMSRAIYATGDALTAGGHQVEYLFREQLGGRVPLRLQRLTTPFQVLRLLQRRARAGVRYDVVELHDRIAAPYCLLRQTHARLPPAVLFTHGLPERRRRLEAEYRVQQGRPASPRERYAPLPWVVQASYAARHADHVVCCSAEDVHYLRQQGVPRHRLTHYQNGVAPAFLAAGATLAQQRLRRAGMLFLGTWLPRKGVWDVVPAVSAVLRSHAAASFTVAGCGADVATVRNAFPPDLQGRITVIPHLFSDDELIELYARHAVFLLPSFFEGQPLAMIEAAAMGLAIVSTRTCGMIDFLEDERNGYLVPVGDVEALTARLNALTTAELLTRELGEAARRRAQEYPWERAAEILHAAYTTALSPQRSAFRKAGVVTKTRKRGAYHGHFGRP